jgi:phage terminase small subunit
MPRTSRDAEAISHLVDRRVTRLAPPADLDPPAAATWRRVVSSCAAGHFIHADAELLRAYCESAVLAQEAYAQMQQHGRIVDGRVSPWLMLFEKSTRALASLAPRLRLGPSARTDPRTTARALNKLTPSIYETLGLMDDEVGRG